MLSLAFSPCPNDTFIFDALVHGKIDLEGLSFDYRLADVETLNRQALAGETDMIKVSFYAWPELREAYALLNSGCAMGSGNGPLLVAKSHLPDLTSPLSGRAPGRGIRVALPGEHTTAHLLFSLAFPEIRHKVFMQFSQIENAVLSGTVDAGVLIHENRFTYKQKGLKKIMDLGGFWEKKTSGPLPLGGIVARKRLGRKVIGKLNRIMLRSVEFAMKHPAEVMPFVKEHAQEMDEEIMKKHIRLYVNRFTVDNGE